MGGSSFAPGKGRGGTQPGGVEPKGGPGLGPGKRTLVEEMEGRHAPPGRQEPASSGAPAGRPLPDLLRTRMERAFGADFSSVRVHESAEAEAMGALAYTQGTNIFVAPGHHDPSSREGQELIGHELAHVVQQAQGRVVATEQATGAGVNRDPALEREADEGGARAARGESAVAAPARGDLERASRIDAGAAPPSAIQYKLHKIVDPDRGEVQPGQRLPVGVYLRDLKTGLEYRHVSTYPDSSKILLRNRHGDALHVYSFETDSVGPYGLDDHERSLGRDINREMEQVNNSHSDDPTIGVYYEHTYMSKFPHQWNAKKDVYIDGYADPAFFERVAPMCWVVKAGVSASQAVRAWLRGLTIAECATVLVAIQLQEFMKVIGEEHFDFRFGRASPYVTPPEKRLKITNNIGECMPKSMLKGAGTDDEGRAKFKLGAKYFLQNHSAYLRKHPVGAMRGENAVYMGVHEDSHYFEGFGISAVPIEKMFKILLKAYNLDRTEEDCKAIIENTTTCRVPKEDILRERTKGHSYIRLFQAWQEDIHPHYQIKEGCPETLTLEEWLEDPETGIMSEGVMLNTAEILRDLLTGM